MSAAYVRGVLAGSGWALLIASFATDSGGCAVAAVVVFLLQLGFIVRSAVHT